MFKEQIEELVKSLDLEDVDGVVIYTDGSSDPVYNLTGGGIHGYTYKNEEPKRGLGLGKWKATETGYSAEPEKTVTIKEYFDGILSLLFGTNNTAELITASVGLLIAEEFEKYGVKKVVFRIDSNYTIEGIKTYVTKWAENNWLKADGNRPANIEIWKTTYDTRERITAKGIDWDIIWVKGHQGEPGNEAADTSADIGRVINDIASDNRKETGFFSSSAAQGYWKTDVSDKINFLTGNLVIFDASEKPEKVSRFHLFSNEKNDVSLYGIADTTGCYSIIQLKEPPEYLNEIIARQHESLSDEVSSAIGSSVYYHLNVRNAFSPSTLAIQSRHGIKTLVPGTRYNELKVLGKGDYVTEILYPVKFAMEGFNYHNALSIILDGFMENKYKDSPVFNVIEVTNYVYSMTKSAKGIPTYKLKDELNNASGKLDLSKYFPNVKTEIGLNPLLLSFGSDLPRKEILSGASKLSPVAYVLYWEEAGSFKRAFILETEEGISIWHNPWRSVL